MTAPLRRTTRRTAATALGALLLLAPAGAASATSADPSDGGLWYYTATGMDQLHQQATGEGITVALVDTPVNPDSPDLVGTNLLMNEPAYCAPSAGAPAPSARDDEGAHHGTTMASIILGTGAGTAGKPGVRGIAPDATVEVFALAPQDVDACHGVPGRPGGDNAAFHEAITSGADIVNVSGDYPFSADEMIYALREGVIVVASGGNDGGFVHGSPAFFNGVVSVGTLTPDVQLDETSPKLGGVDVVAPGADFRVISPTYDDYGRTTGSSNAAAFTSGALALVWSAYPDATANQILQSLVRNAGGEEHEPQIVDDAWGYGAVNVRQMLAVDPTAYPDENPFLSDDPDAHPSVAEIEAAAAEPGPTASSAPDTAAGGTGDDESDAAATSAVPVLAAAGGALLVVAAVVAIVLVARRRGRRTPPSTSYQQQPHQHAGTETPARGGHHG
ncbi:S8 family peptidase [Cellulomonas hominis]|uniref:S8 family peptidase n=1 Tax=Cellulomonas hominis TaxID=156981 RepID=UPI001B9428C9|nr:S8/S53 family peptidase [Cellulomonas hominis]VTR76752.1 Major intracellular serine protease [Cellulomonas hominis]